LSWALIVWLALSGLNWAQAPETRQTANVAQGVEHWQIRRDEQGDRWLINALLVDPRLARLQLGIALDEVLGAETTSSIAARYGALAAVNGGYFRTSGNYRGEQMGALVVNSKVLSDPAKGRAALAIGELDGRFVAASAHLKLVAELTINGRLTRAVNGLNRPREPDELIVFTSEFHRTTLTAPDGVEVVVKRNRVVAINDAAGSQPIPPDGYVLSAHGVARLWLLANLRRGARVAIKTALEAEPAWPFKPAFILGGGPRLLAAGKSTVEAEIAKGGFPDGFYTTRHPRTAIGWRADGKFLFVTVDGRQPQKSVGMTIAELAALMRELGCVEALNLDGGGSTTMVVKNKLVNNPSDPAGERAVSDALLILPRTAK
jgi:exopolysaccharide biosynthesis protein